MTKKLCANCKLNDVTATHHPYCVYCYNSPSIVRAVITHRDMCQIPAGRRTMLGFLFNCGPLQMSGIGMRNWYVMGKSLSAMNNEFVCNIDWQVYAFCALPIEIIVDYSRFITVDHRTGEEISCRINGMESRSHYTARYYFYAPTAQHRLHRNDSKPGSLLGAWFWNVFQY